MTRDEWMVLPVGIDGRKQMYVRRGAVVLYGPNDPESGGTWFTVRGNKGDCTTTLPLAEFEALLFGGEPGSGEYERAAPLKTVLEQERDTARQQRDDYKRQLLELQRKCEAMTGASTYGNAAVMFAEADIALTDCLGNVPHSDEMLEEWREERNNAQERVNIHRDAFLRLYREREARRG